MPPHGLLGKKPAKLDPRTLKLRKYLPITLPTLPSYVNWTKGFQINWDVFLNDQLGCCTISACGHAIQTWSLNQGRMITVPESAILAGYEQACGYDPADPSTDQGGVEIDVLNFFRKTGIGGHTILAYADPDPGNIAHIKQAIYFFGGVYIGFSVPQSALDQFDAGQPWTPVQNDGGIVGGHAVFVQGYYDDGLVLDTWGKSQMMSWAFWSDPRYVDESHALLSADWFNARGFDPSGLDLATLQADLTAVTG